MIEAICAIVGVVVGIAIGMYLARMQGRQREVLSEQREALSRELMEAQKVQFQETVNKVEAQMKAATEEMLRQRQQEFAQQSNQHFGQIVGPLKESIQKMEQTMHDNTLKQATMGGDLKSTIEQMMRQSVATKESADELARVFKHQSKVQGDWGEAILDELLQSQGLKEGIHYDTQTSIRDAEGHTVRGESGQLMRPDVIMHLDTQRDVIIDSKVSLTDFMDYVNAEDPDERQHYLERHIESLQKHVKELAQKDYSSYIQPPKVRMNYVIMFVPHTGALWTALNAKPSLWRKAMEQNVYIADEQSLMAALRIINLTWTQIVQAQNHERVYALATEMLNRVGQFYKHYQSVGRCIAAAQKSFEEGEKKLQMGGQSILNTCGKLQKLGAKQSAVNPLPEEIAES